MATAVTQFYFRFRTGWRHFLQKINVYQHTEYRQDISIYRRDITISVLQKQMSGPPYWNFSSGFDFNHVTVIRMKFCIKLPYFIYSGPPTAEIWRHNDFFKMAAAAALYYFRFPTCWCHSIRKVKVYQQTKFCRHISIHGWDITTSVFEKQTSAMLEFYFRFRHRPFRRNRRVLLHRAAEFHPNCIIHHRNMISYRFSRWRPSAMLYLLWGNGGPPMKCLSSSELDSQIACLSD